VRNLPPIEKIARLDRHTLGELILGREHPRPQMACYECEEAMMPLVPYNGKILCPRDLALASMGRL